MEINLFHVIRQGVGGVMQVSTDEVRNNFN